MADQRHALRGFTKQFAVLATDSDPVLRRNFNETDLARLGFEKLRYQGASEPKSRTGQVTLSGA
jgi:hypothetical protein